MDEVKSIMTQNIEKVMERGDRLEDLIAQTEDLEAHVSNSDFYWILFGGSCLFDLSALLIHPMFCVFCIGVTATGYLIFCEVQLPWLTCEMNKDMSFSFENGKVIQVDLRCCQSGKTVIEIK